MNLLYPREANGKAINTNTYYHTILQKAIEKHLRDKKKIIVKCNGEKKTLKVKASSITLEHNLFETQKKCDIAFMSDSRWVFIELINTNKISKEKRALYKDKKTMLISIFFDELLVECGYDEDILEERVIAMISKYSEDTQRFVLLTDYSVVAEQKKAVPEYDDKGAFITVRTPDGKYAIMKRPNAFLAKQLQEKFGKDGVYTMKYDSKKSLAENVKTKRKI